MQLFIDALEHCAHALEHCVDAPEHLDDALLRLEDKPPRPVDELPRRVVMVRWLVNNLGHHACEPEQYHGLDDLPEAADFRVVHVHGHEG